MQCNATHERASNVGVEDKDLVGVAFEDGVSEVVQSAVQGQDESRVSSGSGRSRSAWSSSLVTDPAVPSDWYSRM